MGNNSLLLYEILILLIIVYLRAKGYSCTVERYNFIPLGNKRSSFKPYI